MSQSNISIDLSQFQEEITLSDGEKISNIYAYRMDGNINIKNMARYADLGTPPCCDYLYFYCDTKAVLIEDTCFEQTLKRELSNINQHIVNKNQGLKKYLKNNLIEVLKKDIYIKVYGAFIILCRLEKEHKKIADKLIDKDFSFWFIINDEGDIPAIDNLGIIPALQNSFKEKLEGALNGAKLVKHTKVLLKKSFKKELQKH